MTTKSGLMLGLGESKEEIVAVLKDLREAGVDIVTLGQYLQPTREHLPVERFYAPEEFDALPGLCFFPRFPVCRFGSARAILVPRGTQETDQLIPVIRRCGLR